LAARGSTASPELKNVQWAMMSGARVVQSRLSCRPFPPYGKNTTGSPHPKRLRMLEVSDGGRLASSLFVLPSFELLFHFAQGCKYPLPADCTL
jgi:hypothetical protein